MADAVKPASAHAFKRRIKAAAFEIIRRYHRAVPGFVELYAGKPARPGPIFAKEAQLLHVLTRLLMPQAVVEIGVGGAASTLAFAEALRLNGRGRLISIDVNQWLIDRARLLLRSHGLEMHVSIIEGRSDDPATRRQIEGHAPRIDILFIDGDHSFAGCRGDFDRYHDLVAPGGIVVFHDTAPFPADQAELVMRLPPDEGGSPPEWNRDGSGIYHRPDVAKAIDQVMAEQPEYSLLSLQTLAEPSCGMAILQRTQTLYQPRVGPTAAVTSQGSSGLKR
jgi:predicted O-methyltransferase YrrM